LADLIERITSIAVASLDKGHDFSVAVRGAMQVCGVQSPEWTATYRKVCSRLAMRRVERQRAKTAVGQMSLRFPSPGKR